MPVSRRSRPGPLGDRAIEDHLTQRGEKPYERIGGHATGEELAPGHDRIVEPMSTGHQTLRTP